MPATLFSKVWDLHAVRKLPTGQTQLFVGLHLVHEVTSPQAFEMLRARGWSVPFPTRTVATVDHIVPTASLARPFADAHGRGDAHRRSSRTAASSASRCTTSARRAGHRPRHRSRAGAHAARHDDRLRRQPHVHARRVRRARVRHRHLAGARRPRVAVPRAGAAEGAAHRRDGRARAAASTRRTSSSRSSAGSA